MGGARHGRPRPRIEVGRYDVPLDIGDVCEGMVRAHGMGGFGDPIVYHWCSGYRTIVIIKNYDKRRKPPVGAVVEYRAYEVNDPEIEGIEPTAFADFQKVLYNVKLVA